MCSSQCVRKNRDRVLARIHELEKTVAQLERRGVTLATQNPVGDAQKNSLEISRKALEKAQKLRNFKLRKTQMMSQFLQKNLKQINKKTMLDFLSVNNGT